MTTTLLILLLAQTAAAPEAFFEAARAGDRAAVVRQLDAGVSVNAHARYNATALMFAADKGHLDLVSLLIERGADVNAEDTFYHFKAIDLALMNNRHAVARFLLEHGSRGASGALDAGIRAADEALVKAALAGPDLTPTALTAAVALAKRGSHAAITEMVAAAAAARPAPAASTAAVVVPAATLQSYAGTYRSEDAGISVTVTTGDNTVTLTTAGQPPLVMTPTAEGVFARWTCRI